MNETKRTNRNKRKKRKVALASVFFISPSYAKLQMNFILNALNSRKQRVPEPVKGQVSDLKGQAWDWEWRTRDVTERNTELRRLIGLWQRSNCDLNALFKKHRHLQNACSAGRTVLVPNRDGKAQLAWSPDLGDFQLPAEKREALRLFIQLLVNPLSSTLRGPCPRCDDYYLQARTNNTTYCKRQCGSVKTALAATRARRQKERNRMLEAARNAVSDWEEDPKGNWKTLVVKRVSEVSRDPVTIKWVTRAVSYGELGPPSNGFAVLRGNLL